MIPFEIPKEQDWDNWQEVPTRGLDRSFWLINLEYAKKHFLGRSHEECFELFENNFMACLDDFFYTMSRKCFCYYIFALAKYLDKVMNSFNLVKYDTSDVASGFLNFIEYRLENDPATIRPIWKDLKPFLDLVASNQTKLEADKNIYGDFIDKLNEIVNLAKNNKLCGE